ncbi:MAG: N-formyl-4-amino-5-aminomethyl-2-methylpyrimidine deformylase [Phycisphaerae bacterium]|nr:N-formyl-4-amino-5-aminomethyl-2-methylpyrimidine deformylase [Phycisphaerae bacterium]
MTLNATTRGRILAAADSLRDELVDTVSRMVQINTVNPYCGDETASLEKPGQLDLRDRLAAAGFATTLFEPPADVYAQAGMIGPAGRSWEDRPNLVGELTLGDGSGRSLILNCHMDTVGAEGMTIDPFGGEVRDGCIHGRGSSDSKGNLAVGLFAVRALQAAGVPLNGRLIFESVVDEECNGGGAGTVACCLAGYRADAAICLDGLGTQPIVGCNGVLTLRLDVHGRAGHAAMGAVNAIDKARVLADAMDVLKRQRAAAAEPTMVNLGVFHAGTIPAIVPGEATLAYNLTYTVAEAEQSKRERGAWGSALLREQIERLIADAGGRDPWLADHAPTLTWVKDLFPYATPLDAEIVRVVGDAAAAATGRRPAPFHMLAWSDACHTSLAGIPTVGFGCGLAGKAHAADECVRIDDLMIGVRTVALAIAAFLSTEAGA